MYVLLLGSLLGFGFWLIGSSARRRSRVWLGGTLIAGAALLVVTMVISAEYLWYDALGFTGRFWTFTVTRIFVVVASVLIAVIPALALLRHSGFHLRRMAIGLATFVGIVWGLGAWPTVLLYFNSEAAGVVEPMLGLDVGFYLFTLPLLDELFGLCLIIAVSLLVFVLCFRDDGSGLINLKTEFTAPTIPLLIPLASLLLAIVLAFGAFLRVFHLLYSEMGVVMGPGWTDVHVRLPGLLVLCLVFIVAGALPLSAHFRGFMTRLVKRWLPIGPPILTAVLGAWVAIGGLWMVLVVAAPQLTQWLVVKPNEITFEIPYIERNIEFTRKAFQLDEIEVKQFPAETQLTEASAADNKHLLSEVRLWDWQALDAVYKQFQEIRLYYEFVDVDIDRYQIGDRYRQVMVSARELAQRNLPVQSRTFVNQRFKYTHGYGYTLAPVSDFTPEGLPNMLVKDIPPVTQAAELRVDRPGIYYGEMTTEHVIVNTSEPEFDYPSGDKNVYTHYDGTGGVVLNNFWRRFLFGWKFDGTLLLLSSYPHEESRILYHRQVQERVKKIAPFLVFDQDPYIAAVEGRLVWIVDAYTSSSYYPYSQPFDSHEQIEYRGPEIGERTVQRLDGENYVRNSVKAVVDAYDGSVELYIFEPDDPIINAWQRALPGVFKSRQEMPEGIRAHVRYPQDLLLVQGLTFARYHMTDPEVFYNQEDVWVRATEKHYQEIKPVEPYYVMWEQPGSDQAEFVLILPFTPKNRQVLIGWIAAMSDGDNYGRFIAYTFPKEKRVLGPQQVETKIDQDSFLSGQLTLWNQQGSEVIRGNVLAIPIDDSLLYVEPIYLRAETAAYPELRLVAVMQGDKFSYAETFEEALLGLFEATPTTMQTVLSNGTMPMEELARVAKAAFDAYLTATGEQQFADASEQLQILSEVLSEMDTLKSVADDRPMNEIESAQPVR
ncbi:MAG: uncharacterized membrane protein (UPF0182 family) [Candidatus Azotimanducaceae bacterium]|jgi:uncharacterized membrane protein (UPF0182 family)